MRTKLRMPLCATLATLAPAVVAPAQTSGTVDGDRFVSPQGTVLMDQLYIVDEQNYWAGNGNCWGGGTIFGIDFDLQLCDDMDGASDFQITVVTNDGIGFLGEGPVSLRIGVFANENGRPSEDYTFDADWPISDWSEFTDTVFGLLGVRATASGLSGVIPAGHYWVMGQPATDEEVNGNGDWFYTPRGDLNNGEDTFGRDGNREVGDHSVPQWRSMGDSGFGAGDSSMKVEGILLESDLRISLEGECPGDMLLTWEGAAPDRWGAILASRQLGDWWVPGGPCGNGTRLDLYFPVIVAYVRTGSDGIGLRQGPIPTRACGIYLQMAVYSGTPCQTSNVVQI